MIILPAPAADTDAYAPVVNIPFLVPVESGQHAPESVDDLLRI